MAAISSTWLGKHEPATITTSNNLTFSTGTATANYMTTAATYAPNIRIATYVNTYADTGNTLVYDGGSGNVAWGSSINYPKPAMLFDNEYVSITEDGKVYIDGKIEMNPTKIGKMMLKALQKYRQDNGKEQINDAKELFS